MSDKTRPVELQINESYGNDTGQWWTEAVDIPIDTPEDQIEDVAAAVWYAEFDAAGRKEWIAGVNLYRVPELEQVEEMEEMDKEE